MWTLLLSLELRMPAMEVYIPQSRGFSTNLGYSQAHAELVAATTRVSLAAHSSDIIFPENLTCSSAPWS